MEWVKTAKTLPKATAKNSVQSIRLNRGPIKASSIRSARRCSNSKGCNSTMSLFYTVARGGFALPHSESANTADGQALSPHSGQTPLVLPVRS